MPRTSVAEHTARVRTLLNAVSQRTLEGWVPAKRPGTSSAEAARAAGAEGSGAQG